MEDKKVTIYDIAEKTGFSAVTVHRALNNKERISQKTKALILKTAEQMGYKVNPAAQGLRRAPIKIGAVLFCQVEEYAEDIVEGIAACSEELQKYNAGVDIRKIDYINDEYCINKTCEIIKEFTDNDYNGIIVSVSVSTDKMDDICAVLKQAVKKNIPIAAVANDIPIKERIIFVAINAFMAGSMAAQMLELSCKGRDVALLVANNTTPIDKGYIDGFMEYSKNGVFSSIRIYEHFDQKEKVIELTNRMLQENPKLGGVYMASASSVLACECIEKNKKQELSIITTDLLTKTPKLLKSKTANATIFQNPYKQGKNVAKFLYNYITEKTDSGTHLITPHILLSSNVESYTFNHKENDNL